MTITWQRFDRQGDSCAWGGILFIVRGGGWSFFFIKYNFHTFSFQSEITVHRFTHNVCTRPNSVPIRIQSTRPYFIYIVSFLIIIISWIPRIFTRFLRVLFNFAHAEKFKQYLLHFYTRTVISRRVHNLFCIVLIT